MRKQASETGAETVLFNQHLERLCTILQQLTSREDLQQGLVVGVRCDDCSTSAGFRDAIGWLIVQNQRIRADACAGKGKHKRCCCHRDSKSALRQEPRSEARCCGADVPGKRAL